MPVTSGAQSTEANLNATTPAAPAGSRNVTFQAGSPYPDPNNPGYQVRDITAYISAQGEIGIVIDGAGSVPTTGSKKFIQVPFAGTVTGWTILSDIAGQCQITVKKSTYSGFPTTASIVASAPPVLGTVSPSTTAQKATSTTVTGWTTAFSAGDVFEFNLDSVSTCKWILLVLQVTKS